MSCNSQVFFTVFQSEEYNCIFIQITTPGCECLSPTSSLPLQGVALIALYLCADCVLLHLLASVIAYAPPTWVKGDPATFKGWLYRQDSSLMKCDRMRG